MIAAYYLPIDFSDSYRTNFKFSLNMAYIYPYGDKPVPFYQRFRLGGFDDLRGYDFNDIGPRFYMLTSPGSSLGNSTNKGGDKKVVLQTEYFVPLIQEAGIKGLIFFDQGQVFDDNEPISFKKGFAKDVGFGFRWITPIAPFRFEFAYPILEGGRLGEMHPIFSLGY
jgi:outer membrane protein insertion porin family